MSLWDVIEGDARVVLRRDFFDATVDAVVCDPPYELGFMGRKWDASGVAYDPHVWRQVLRVLKPGGHLLAFGGTRTYHRMVCAIEDAGFEVRDSIHWIYGSGFPKSLDVSKAFDKAAGAEREVLGANPNGRPNMVRVKASVLRPRVDAPLTAPATEAARQWSGWGTALKPAHEPIVVARKPLDGTVAANVLAHGTGAINVDGCRVKHASAADLDASKAKNPGRADLVSSDVYGAGRPQQSVNDAGRWPPNIVLSHAPECGDECADGCAVAEMDGQSGKTKTPDRVTRGAGGQHGRFHPINPQRDVPCYGDSGGASRFFPTFRYQAKASRADRDAGLDGFPIRRTGGMRGTEDADMLTGAGNVRDTQRSNVHPTVKPTELMRWLVRLVTPPGGLVLDPFTGSGSTGVAAVAEGFRFAGVELSPEYAEIARARIGAKAREQ